MYFHKQQLLEYLQIHCLGRAQARRAKDLAQRFETDIRAINDLIRSLRLDGIIIGSAKEPPYGYYLPTTPGEVDHCIDTYKNELYDMLAVYNRQKRARRTYFEDLTTRSLFKCTESGQMVMAFPGAG